MYFISFVSIFVESTLGAIFLSFSVTLPFFLFLVNKNKKNMLKYSFLFAIIYSIQSNSFLYFFIFFLTYSVGTMILLSYLKYENKNLLLFSLFQIGMVILFFSNKITSLILCGLGFVVLNYFYIQRSKDKEEGIE